MLKEKPKEEGNRLTYPGRCQIDRLEGCPAREKAERGVVS
jgi:hypothetical protein